MVSGINNKIKVVWLCHFANQGMKAYFNTPKPDDFAPWIGHMLNIFKNNDLLDLHIVSPNVYTNKDCSFNKDGITYHFYRHRMPLIPRKLYNYLGIDFLTNYRTVKKKTKNIIDSVQPDIIHLHGAENPYYSAGIPELLNRYPVITTIQGFIRHTSGLNKNIKHKIDLEEKILKRCKHFGTRTEEMNKVILEINPEAKLHFHNYPLVIPTVIKNNIGEEEPIDCIFFARVSRNKGIEDLLYAISIVKNEYPDISVTVIGAASNSYFTFLNKLCNDLAIQNNVSFTGFLPLQKDIHEYALKAKMYVLPTYHDIIPGTIIESMFMKLPVIAYAVGGIPELNNDVQTVVLIEKNNINALAENIIELKKNIGIRKMLANEAYSLANKRFNNNVNIVSDLTTAYKSILNI
jgi:glycosyltransferase involved in cell wall biosynthesis